MQFNFYVLYFVIILGTICSATLLVGDIEKYTTLALQIVNLLMASKGISDNSNAPIRNGKNTKFKY